MSRGSDIKSTLSERITMAPGTITQLSARPGQLAQQLKLITGGTLEIGGSTTMQGAHFASFARGGTFGSLYPVSANEILSLNSSGDIYLWASGATCVVAILDGTTVQG